MFLLSFMYNQALADPYFKGLAKVEREPSCQPITKMEFEFERKKATKEDVKELIFREILEYHPQLLKDYMNGTEKTNFLYPRYLFCLEQKWSLNLSFIYVYCTCYIPMC
jgi:hypothetical protein